MTPGHDPVQKVTLVPRGQARGLTWFIPADDPTLISKQQLFARIVGGLGGRAAEEVIFGEPEVTTGAAGDLQQITSLAKQVGVRDFILCCDVSVFTCSLFFSCLLLAGTDASSILDYTELVVQYEFGYNLSVHSVFYLSRSN